MLNQIKKIISRLYTKMVSFKNKIKYTKDNKLQDDTKNDLIQMLQQAISGSTTEIDTVSDTQHSQDEILKTLMNSEWIESALEEVAKPSYRLLNSKQNKHHWLLNATTMSIDKVPQNVEVIPVEKQKDHKMLCLIGNSYYIVAEDLIHCTGWN